MNSCKICKNKIGNKIHIAREMMFGYKDKFAYLECVECGCVQIKEIPKNISKYYPRLYYSFQEQYYLKNNLLKFFLKRQRTKYYLGKKNVTGMLLSKIYGMPYYFNWLKGIKINLESEILDVGCGTGHIFIDMHKDGFSHLTGIDPNIQGDIYYDKGIKILKKELFKIDQKFDLIMLHHSFEHMPHPLSVFKELYRLIKPGGCVLIRIPIASSFAWRKYGVNWVQLDAPRHYFLHTTKSIQIIADQVGLQITNVLFDSTEFQFWGSEQYLRNIPLNDLASYFINPNKSFFSANQIESFKLKAAKLNKNKDGDSACFYLKKS